ncbi:MAG: DNA primase [Thermoguttaceae bacterium]
MATQELTVSGGLSFDTKERVKQAIDIVELVGAHIQLRRQGRNYVGLCPWHDDTRPSLQINPERQSFKCWVCDIGGDVFTWIMKTEGVEFREALEMLADRAGITLEKPKTRQEAQPGGTFDKRALYRAMVWAEKQYHHCLIDTPDAEPARRYLQERSITPESIEKFHLGFSPVDRDWILHQASKNENISKIAGRAKILEAVGILAKPSEGGTYYDRFKGRLLFSIRDAQARPVGFGGRVLPDVATITPAKYVNSPETPLFTKSKLLYGLDLARQSIRKNAAALVMEGYTDVIVAHQYGFDNAVAVLGTALGADHIKILKHYTDRIILVLDGDEAGQRRTNEVLELFVAEQVDLRILTLPEGLDPCDYLHQKGVAAFAELLANSAVDALEHAFTSVTRGVDVDRDVHGASRALERLISIVAKAPRLRADTTGEDRFREEKILQRLAAWFRVDEKEVRRRLTALRRRSQGRPTNLPTPTETDSDTQPGELPETIDPTQREFLELLLIHPECLPSVREQISLDYLGAGICGIIYDTCCRLADADIEPSFDRLMLEFDEPAVKNLLVDLDETSHSKGRRASDPQELLRELINTFKRKESERQRPRQITALREGGLDENRQIDMLEEILRQERDRQGITKPTDG